MTISSTENSLERGLDTMFVVYSLLEGHPASGLSEDFIRVRAGWFTTTFALFEAKAILTKVYGVEPAKVTEKLALFAAGPIQVIAPDTLAVLEALRLADTCGLDLTDAALLQAAQSCGANRLTTDDGKLAKVCTQQGITVENPIDYALRQQIAVWEHSHLPDKGLPRILRHIRDWLQQTHADTAAEFWSQTGSGSHLP